MKRISAREFKNQTGRYQDMALAAPIVITKHGRPALVLMSYQAYKTLNAAGAQIQGQDST